MTILKIALLQILPGGSLEENLRTGVEACRTAKSLGAASGRVDGGGGSC